VSAGLLSRAGDLVEQQKRGQNVGVPGVLLLLAAGASSANAIRIAGIATASDLLLLLALAIGALSGFSPRLPAWARVSLWLLTLSLLMSFVGVDDLGANFAPVASLVLAYFAWPIALAGAFRGGWCSAVSVLNAWVAGIVISAGVAVSDYLNFTHLGLSLTGLDFAGQRFSGLSVHPNHLALSCAMALPLVLARSATTARRRGRLLGVFVFSILGVGVLLAGGRAALVAAVGGMLLVLLTLTAGRLRVVAVLVVAVATFALVTRFLPAQNAQAAHLFEALQRLSESQAGSDQGHLDLGVAAWQAFQQNPIFGSGLRELNSAHDIYLQVLSSLGLLGAVALLVFMGGAIESAWRLYRTSGLFLGPSAVVGAIFPSAVVWLATGLFQNQIDDRYILVPIATGIVVRATSRESQSGD